MAVQLTRRDVLSTSVAALATTGLAGAGKKKSAAASIPPVMALITGDEPRVDFEKYRKIIVSPDVNPPEPFRGFGGYCGWPTVCRLQNGDLFLTFSAGYWHASWPTPWDMPPEARQRLLRPDRKWLGDWDAPEGGRMMWIRSRDQGKTWSRPRSFPVVPGAYYVGDVVQLSDGTMIAGARLKPHWGYFNQMPSTALEYARIAVNRQSKTLIFRSDDNGHTWKEVPHLEGGDTLRRARRHGRSLQHVRGQGRLAPALRLRRTHSRGKGLAQRTPPLAHAPDALREQGRYLVDRVGDRKQ